MLTEAWPLPGRAQRTERASTTLGRGGERAARPGGGHRSFGTASMALRRLRRAGGGAISSSAFSSGAVAGGHEAAAELAAALEGDAVPDVGGAAAGVRAGEAGELNLESQMIFI